MFRLYRRCLFSFCDFFKLLTVYGKHFPKTPIDRSVGRMEMLQRSNDIGCNVRFPCCPRFFR